MSPPDIAPTNGDPKNQECAVDAQAKLLDELEITEAMAQAGGRLLEDVLETSPSRSAHIASLVFQEMWLARKTSHIDEADNLAMPRDL